MKIIVLCTHPFALPTIQALANGQLLAGVVTSVTSANFRSKLDPVLQHYKVPLLLVRRKNLVEKLSALLQEQQVDVVLVMTFKYRIPAELLSIPRWGFINFHPGSLPHFRGPDPAFWQIKNQLTHGAVAVHQMDATFDTGPLITIAQFPITPTMTYNHYMSDAGFMAMQLANTVIQTLHQSGQLPLQVQDEGQVGYQPKPSMQDFRINWQEDDILAIRAVVNACNPNFGGAVTLLRNSPLQILQVTPVGVDESAATIGQIVNIEPTKGLLVSCKNKELLRIDIIQSAEGIMTGTRFAEMAVLQLGEHLT